MGDEPVWHDGKVIGWVTSGGYAHTCEILAQGIFPRNWQRTRRKAPSRSKSSASAARPPSSANRCSTRKPNACACECIRSSDQHPDDRLPLLNSTSPYPPGLPSPQSHPEEAQSAVSKDGQHTREQAAILRDGPPALLRMRGWCRERLGFTGGGVGTKRQGRRGQLSGQERPSTEDTCRVPKSAERQIDSETCAVTPSGTPRFFAFAELRLPLPSFRTFPLILRGTKCRLEGWAANANTSAHPSRRAFSPPPDEDLVGTGR